MGAIIFAARIWITFVCGAIAAVGMVAMPYYVWTIFGPVLSVVAAVMTVASGVAIWRYRDVY